MYSAWEHTTDAPRTVVVPAPRARIDAATRCLEKLAHAHASITASGIAKLAEYGIHAGVPFVAFDCEAVCDGEAMIAHLGETRTRVSYPEAMAVIDRLTSAISAAHEAPLPSTFGALSWANVLVGRDGRLHLFGLGHNVVAFDEAAVLSGAPSVFFAPEVAGSTPDTRSLSCTPNADVYAFVLLQRSVLAYTDVPSSLEQAFRGELTTSDARALATLIAWSNERILTAAPHERPSMRDARAQFAREWALLGMSPAHETILHRLSQIAAGMDQQERKTQPAALTLSPDGSWVRTSSGESFDLNGPLRRLVLCLAQQRRASPGLSLSIDTLLEAGWPGERPIREAGLNRVYVALSKLRKLGLRTALQRADAGYRIDPRVRIQFEELDASGTDE